MEKPDITFSAPKLASDDVSLCQIELAELQKGRSNAYTGDHITAETSISPVERSLFWKAATLICMLAALIYFVAYLDRNSIGNARIAGMQKSLHMTNDQYAMTVSIFFIGYIICMLPANIVVRLIPPNFAIGGTTLVFGALVVGLGAAKNYGTVLVIRILLGFFQAFIQGLGVYVSVWFRRDEIASVQATFYSAATISGAFSGFIAYGTTRNLNLKTTGRPPWRNLYYIDGAVAMFVGLVTTILMPRFPDQMKKTKHWLFTKEEIELACERAASFNTVGTKINSRQIWSALKDPKSYAFFVMQCAIATGVGTIGVYLPSFITAFGYSPLRTQLFSTIPYACAFVTLLTVSFLSDRFNRKGVFMCGTISLSIIGYIILLTNVSTPAKIVAVCLITSGLYPTVILISSWLMINTGGFTKRGTTWAMAEIGGQCFTIMGTHVYTHPPRYIQGHVAVLSLLVLALIATIMLIFWYKCENARKDRIEAEYRERGELHPHSLRSLEEELDFHQNFRYIL